MTGPVRVGDRRRPGNGAPVRHFGRAVGENWWMQPVSDGAGGRARAGTGVGAHRP